MDFRASKDCFSSILNSAPNAHSLATEMVRCAIDCVISDMEQKVRER